MQGRAPGSQRRHRRSQAHPPQARARAGGQEVRPRHERGPDRLVHPHGRQDRRAASSSTANRTSSRAPTTSRRCCASCRCRSRPPTRSTCSATTCRPTCSTASDRSIARRWRTPASRRAVIEKIIEGKLGSFYEQVCLVDQPSIRDPKSDGHRDAPGRDRQARREHQRRPVRPVQGRRLRIDHCTAHGLPQFLGLD